MHGVRSRQFLGNANAKRSVSKRSFETQAKPMRNAGNAAETQLRNANAGRYADSARNAETQNRYAEKARCIRRNADTQTQGTDTQNADTRNAKRRYANADTQIRAYPRH